MRTVKQVSELSGVSIRTLHYYDEIGLFQPSETTAAGYRLYTDEDLQRLQQILFFRELDFPLKEIKVMMSNPTYDNNKAFAAQKKLLKAKRDRLENLLKLLDQLIGGEKTVHTEFKAFDMSEYFEALQEFKKTHADEIEKQWGSMAEFEKITANFKEKEQTIAETAIKYYGSIEKYTEAMKNNLENFSENMEALSSLKEQANDYISKTDSLLKELTSDLNRDAASPAAQAIIAEWMKAYDASIPKGMDMGDNYWQVVTDSYLSPSTIGDITDKKYGEGASGLIGRALRVYWHLE